MLAIAALAVGGLGSAKAVAASFGVIGDSLSVGMNADDRCSGVLGCLDKLGATRELNFADGNMPWSLYNRLRRERGTLTRSISAAENGARWDDALQQARTLTNSTDLEVVHIELGGNDVCADDLAGIDDIESHMDAALEHLANRLPNGTIILSEVPDVARLRGVMRDQPHFLFETFQDLWDLNYDRFRPEAVAEVCTALYGAGACLGSAFLRERTEAALRSFLENVIFDSWDGRFPCHRLLASAVDASHRQSAQRLNRQINALLMTKALAYNGRNGVRVLLANNVEERRYSTAEPSKLDGFHLGREGHETLAGVIWDGFKPETAFASLLPDWNGDKRGEYSIVTIADSGAVQLRIIDIAAGRISHSHRLQGAVAPDAVAVIPRYPGLLGPALAFLEAGEATSRVALWAAVSGSALGSVDFEGAPRARGLTVLDDLDGNGVAELAVLAVAQRKPSVHVRDAVTGSAVRQVPFSTWGGAAGLLPAPDLNGNLTPEIGVIKRRKRDGRVRVELKDAVTGVLISKPAFGKGLTPKNHVWISDLTGDLVPELGLLLVREADQAQLVRVRSVVSADKGRYLRLPSGFAAKSLAPVADLDGNGNAEIAVLGVSSNAPSLQVRHYDALAADGGDTLDFGAGLKPLHLAIAEGSAGGSGSKVIVLARDRLQQLRVKTKDAVALSPPLDLVVP